MHPRHPFDRLLPGHSLTSDEAEAVFSDLLAGAYDDAQIASILSLIQARGPTVDELIGGARAMRRCVRAVPASTSGGPIIDTCGTGGAPKTFNISTAAAIVAAAAAGPARIRVAKHGNRSRSGRGSAEVLAALGINIDAPPEVQARCLDEIGVCFCFAIHSHPAMKHAAHVRRSLAFPTIFNLLGPLTNPAHAGRQLIGVYGREEAQKVAHALAGLGAERACVVHGFDGMDEITTRDRTHLFQVYGAGVHSTTGWAARAGAAPTIAYGDPVIPETFDAQDLGIPRAPAGTLEARDLAHGVEIVRAVLAPGPPVEFSHARNIVTLNAAAALVIAGAADSLPTALLAANLAIDSGAARSTLAALAQLSA